MIFGDKFASIIAISFAALAAADQCQDMAGGLNLGKWGTYCKGGPVPVCFGLQWTDSSRTSMCFHPNDASCPTDFPVSCPVQPPVETCAAVCANTADCASSNNVHGTYCKNWNSPAVCFGLYWTDASHTSACFEPASPSCQQSRPVLCSDQVAQPLVSVVATQSPVTNAASQAPVTNAATQAPVTQAATQAAVSNGAPSTQVPQTASVRATVSATQAEVTTAGRSPSTGAAPRMADRPATTAVPVTTATTRATTVTVRPTTTAAPAIPGPTGRYCSSVMGIRMEFLFNNGIGQIDIYAGQGAEAQHINVPNVAYTVQAGGAIVPTDYTPLINLVQTFGLRITPEQVVVTYNLATDSNHVQFGPLKLSATKAQC